MTTKFIAIEEPTKAEYDAAMTILKHTAEYNKIQGHEQFAENVRNFKDKLERGFVAGPIPTK